MYSVVIQRDLTLNNKYYLLMKTYIELYKIINGTYLFIIPYSIYYKFVIHTLMNLHHEFFFLIRDILMSSHYCFNYEMSILYIEKLISSKMKIKYKLMRQSYIA